MTVVVVVGDRHHNVRREDPLDGRELGGATGVPLEGRRERRREGAGRRSRGAVGGEEGGWRAEGVGTDELGCGGGRPGGGVDDRVVGVRGLGLKANMGFIV